jgi:hypothetical protein
MEEIAEALTKQEGPKMAMCLFISHFVLEGLGSSSIWMYQILNICSDFFPLGLPAENNNKYSIFKI